MMRIIATTICLFALLGCKSQLSVTTSKPLPSTKCSPKPSALDKLPGGADCQAPTPAAMVATLSTTAANPTNLSSIPFTLVFSSLVENFTDADVAKINTTNGTPSQLAGQGMEYSFVVSPGADGLVSVSLPAGIVADVNKTTNGASEVITLNYDSTPPAVTLTSIAAAFTTTSPIPVTALFTEPVVNFAVEDVTITNGVVDNFKGSGADYTFDVVPDGNGIVTIDVGPAAASDTAGNGNTPAVQLSRSFDSLRPSLVLTSSAGSPTKTAPISVTATFSKVVSGFTLADLTVTNGSAGNLTGSGSIYYFDVTPSANGPVLVDVAAGVAGDEAGHTNFAAAGLSRIFDTLGPTVVLSSATGNPTNAASFSVTATFAEAVTGFTVTDIIVSNGAPSNVVGSDATWSFDVTPTAEGPLTIDIPAGGVVDAAGNTNAASNQLGRTYDTVAPTVSMSSAEGNPTRNAAIAVTITTSEATTNFTSADLTLANGTISGFSGSGTSYSVTLIPSGQGAVTIDINAGVFTDAAANGNTGATQFSRTYDSVPPPIPTAPTCTGAENSVTTGWTSGGGDTAGFLVVRKYGSAPTWTPTNGTIYSTAASNNLDDYTHWLAYAGAATTVTEQDVFAGMPHHYAIFAYDVTYNYQLALSTSCSPKPMVMLENVPAANFSGSALDIKVGGQNVTEYKHAIASADYWCDEVGYSGWTPVATHITDTVSVGPYRVCVIGRTAGLVEQVTASETYFKKAAHVSVTHPTVYNSKAQLADNFKIEWVDHKAADDGTGTLSFYYAAAKGADCTGATAIATGVSQNTSNKYQNWDTTGVPLGTYYICITSDDGLGSIYSFWANGSVTIEDYCNGTKLTNTLASGNNGAGTVGDPYNICTLTQLDEMAGMVQTAKYYQLRRTIDASATTGWNGGLGWNARAYNFISFNGNGYTISGLTINRATTDSVGLFSASSSAGSIITDLRMENVNITGQDAVGGIVGNTAGDIAHSVVSGAVSGRGKTGGIAGQMTSTATMRDLDSSANVTGSLSFVGGILGVDNGGNKTLTKLRFTGTVTANASGSVYAGGVIGRLSSNLSPALMTGSVTGTTTTDYVGGIAGQALSSRLSRVISAGSVTTPGDLVGGLVGGVSTPMVSFVGSTFLGSVSGGFYTGGLLGRTVSTNASIIGSLATGSVTSTSGSYTGGLAGMINSGPSKILCSYSTGTVSGIGTVGGLAGYFQTGPALIQSSYFMGSVNCSTGACGGLTGTTQGSGNVVRDSFNAGPVAVVSSYAGGLTSTLALGAKILDSYSSGSVTDVGGFVGGLGGRCDTGSTLANSFSSGTVTGSVSGGFWGQRTSTCGTFANVWWHKPGGNTQNCVNSDAASGGTSCANDANISWFQNSANAPLSSWDFINFWKIPGGGGYPILSWQRD